MLLFPYYGSNGRIIDLQSIKKESVKRVRRQNARTTRKSPMPKGTSKTQNLTDNPKSSTGTTDLAPEIQKIFYKFSALKDMVAMPNTPFDSKSPLQSRIIFKDGSRIDVNPDNHQRQGRGKPDSDGNSFNIV
ncbi:hypothetical protein TNIN_87091 [Trichonephila inaurata madagascariensis]|uniref:Uncharacterized protein n=1 Tax=Trichonephila inaurata madagascariensis TaxID=2747483 RepID=A0A8X7CHK9_9ARAC|nr:hypothetical protein TNIN_87091 [Trichonephila inaurata madagascariensis]